MRSSRSSTVGHDPRGAGRHGSRPVGRELRRRDGLADQCPRRTESFENLPRGQRAGRGRRRTRWAVGGQQRRQHHPTHRHRRRGVCGRTRSTSATVRTAWRSMTISVWVANGREGSVMRIDSRTGDQMSPPIRVGSGPRGSSVSATTSGWPTSSPRASAGSTSPRGDTALDRRRGRADRARRPRRLGLGGREVLGDLVRIDPGTETQQPDPRSWPPCAGWRSSTVSLWVASGAFAARRSHRGGTLRVAAATPCPGHYRPGSTPPASTTGRAVQAEAGRL